jgi:hypothetical protein
MPSYCRIRKKQQSFYDSRDLTNLYFEDRKKETNFKRLNVSLDTYFCVVIWRPNMWKNIRIAFITFWLTKFYYLQVSDVSSLTYHCTLDAYILEKSPSELYRHQFLNVCLGPTNYSRSTLAV